MLWDYFDITVLINRKYVWYIYIAVLTNRKNVRYAFIRQVHIVSTLSVLPFFRLVFSCCNCNTVRAILTSFLFSSVVSARNAFDTDKHDSFVKVVLYMHHSFSSLPSLSFNYKKWIPFISLLLFLSFYRLPPDQPDEKQMFMQVKWQNLMHDWHCCSMPHWLLLILFCMYVWLGMVLVHHWPLPDNTFSNLDLCIFQGHSNVRQHCLTGILCSCLINWKFGVITCEWHQLNHEYTNILDYHIFMADNCFLTWQKLSWWWL